MRKLVLTSILIGKKKILQLFSFYIFGHIFLLFIFFMNVTLCSPILVV
jgi:hypothetical protein